VLLGRSRNPNIVLWNQYAGTDLLVLVCSSTFELNDGTVCDVLTDELFQADAIELEAAQ
jgi:hypothetical protein